MKGYIYAVVSCYITVLFEYVLELRGEYSLRNIVGVFSVLMFLIIIGYLNDDRKYYMRFKLHSITLWGKDLS